MSHLVWALADALNIMAAISQKSLTIMFSPFVSRPGRTMIVGVVRGCQLMGDADSDGLGPALNFLRSC
jgi:hypothetical protein